MEIDALQTIFSAVNLLILLGAAAVAVLIVVILVRLLKTKK
ncbi:MAG: hypothetical protein ACOX8R_07640 [Bacillota bacterium]|jgi:hypothetical protein